MGLVTMKLRPYMAMLVEGRTEAVFGPKTAAKQEKEPLKNRRITENRFLVESRCKILLCPFLKPC